MVRLVCRRLTNQTKQACSLNPISRTLAASHKDFMLKQPSWSSFVSTHREPSPAEVCSFLSRLTKETWGTSKRQKDTGKSPGTSRGRMKYKSHGESPIPSQLCGCWPCKGRPPWWEQGSGTMDDGAPGGRTLGFSPNPALCFPSRMETPPPPPPSAPLPHSSASRGCTQACQYTSGITTLRKPDQPIAAGAGPPRWEVPSVDLLPEGIGNTLMGQGSSWGTDFGAGLISTASGTGPPRLPSSYRRRAPHWPWPTGGPGLMDRPHSHLDGGWGVRLEMTPNTNKTHLHHESIYQQVRCWSAWIWLSTFPRNCHRNLSTPNHPQWKTDSGMAWEMSKIRNWMPNKWSTWPKQDMDLDSKNLGLSPMSSWIYICIHILYIYLFL